MHTRMTRIAPTYLRHIGTTDRTLVLLAQNAHPSRALVAHRMVALADREDLHHLKAHHTRFAAGSHGRSVLLVLAPLLGLAPFHGGSRSRCRLLGGRIGRWSALLATAAIVGVATTTRSFAVAIVASTVLVVVVVGTVIGARLGGVTRCPGRSRGGNRRWIRRHSDGQLVSICG